MPGLRSLNRHFLAAFALGMLSLAGRASAQNSFEVQSLLAQEDYYRAMVAFERLPARKIDTDIRVAGAKSAWSLGLTARAADEFERALRDPDLSSEERARLLFARGIIEFQDNRFELSAYYAERAAQLIEHSSALSANIQMLWGEALFKLGRQGMACEKIRAASEHMEAAALAETHYKLGYCLFVLGDLIQSRNALERVPLDHQRAPAALRLLARIALDLNDFSTAQLWLEEGRSRFPKDFFDAWVDYVLAKSAIGQGKGKELDKLIEAARKKHAPSDAWLALTEAAVEAFYQSARISGQAYASMEAQ